jgi:hypothetical protein
MTERRTKPRTKAQPKVEQIDVLPDAEAASMRALFAAEEAVDRAKEAGDDAMLLDAIVAHIDAIELYARLRGLIK